jgi:hypothetical protein
MSKVYWENAMWIQRSCTREMFLKIMPYVNGVFMKYDNWTNLIWNIIQDPRVNKIIAMFPLTGIQIMDCTSFHGSNDVLELVLHTQGKLHWSTPSKEVRTDQLGSIIKSFTMMHIECRLCLINNWCYTWWSMQDCQGKNRSLNRSL